MKNVFKSLIVLVLVVVSFSSCNSDDKPETESSVKVVLTDGPFPFDFATEANVTIDKIELKNESGVYVTVFEGNASYNMVNLTNGVTADFEATTIEPGSYTKIRVTTSAASVMLLDELLNASSSADQTIEVEIEPALVVEEGNTSEVLLDLDLSGSFSFSNNILETFLGWITENDFINACSFHPKLRAVDLNQSGEISGTVTVNGEVVENAQVSITVNGETIYTHTENDGTYKFIGILEGNYTVSVETSNELSGTNSTVIIGTGSATCDIDIN